MAVSLELLKAKKCPVKSGHFFKCEKKIKSLDNYCYFIKKI